MNNRLSGLIALCSCAIGVVVLAGCECECLEGIFSCQTGETTTEIVIEDGNDALPGGYVGIDYAVDGDATFDLVDSRPSLLASGAER